MRRLLVGDGVRFPNNRQAAFTRLDPIADEWLHAEGDWNAGNGSERRVAVKVIDPRGNEVMRVHRLSAEGARAAR